LGVFSWTLAVAGAAAGAYAWMTQAGVSVERASLLFGLYVVCRMTLRRIQPVEALAWVALVILLADPSALFDLGAQLSFVACLALLAAGFWRSDIEIGDVHASRRPGLHVEDFISQIRKTVGSTLKASLAISIATAPLLAQVGLPLVPLAPVFNVLAIPWTGLVVLPTSLLAVATWSMAPVVIQKLLVMPALIMQDAALKVASVLPEPSMQRFFEMPFFVALCAISFFVIRGNRWRWAMVFWGVASWAGSSPMSLSPSMGPLPRVIFFDVGQGDAALFQGREAVMLIDTGPGLPAGGGGAGLIRALRAANVNRIDVLALTHADLDHRGGLVRVLETIPVAELWLPDRMQREQALESIATIAERLGTKVFWREATPLDAARFTRGDLEIEILWPIRGRLGPLASRNRASMVLRVELAGRAFLMAADIGGDVERKLINADVALEADVLKVAHHGSRKSSDTEFLARVSPSVAVVSAPCYASRGLPTQTALSRLRSVGAAIWWTGRDGAVIMTPKDEAELGVSSWGSARNCLPR
jgi:competence protein ComEC